MTENTTTQIPSPALFPRPVRGIIFDLDGTLADTLPVIAMVCNRLLEALGRPSLPVARIEPMIGDGAAALVSQLLTASGGITGGDDFATILDRYVGLLAEVPPGPGDLYDGVTATLAALADRGIPLAVCTNKPEGAARSALTAMGLAARFGTVIGGDTLAMRKPHPAPLCHALAAMDVQPNAALMVGDSANDILAAKQAGVPAVAVSYGYPRMPIASLGADRVIDRFADLLGLIAED